MAVSKETQTDVASTDDGDESALIGGDPWSVSSGTEDLEEDQKESSSDGESSEEEEEGSEKEGRKEEGRPKTALFDGLVKSINDPIELADYTRSLERKQVELEARLSERAALSRPAEEKKTKELTDSELAERLFSDPVSVLDEVRSSIREEILGVQERKEEQRAFWDMFYGEHSDLRGAEDLVELVLQRRKIEWKDVPVSQARKLLATEVRGRVATIRAGGGNEQELSKKPAVTAGVSGASVPRVKEPGGPVTFFDQMRALRSRRSKTAG